MSAATPLGYAARCERYARQRGWAYDEHRMSIGHLTPAQRRRALRKERRGWRKYGDQHRHDHLLDCDVCGLPDPYQGAGDGIGSCDCPRCQCGAAACSWLCTCPPDDVADPLWEISYPEEPYCVTPGCNCCGDD